MNRLFAFTRDILRISCLRGVQQRIKPNATGKFKSRSIHSFENYTSGHKRNLA